VLPASCRQKFSEQTDRWIKPADWGITSSVTKFHPLLEGEGRGENFPNDSRIEPLNPNDGASLLPLLANRGEGWGEFLRCPAFGVGCSMFPGSLEGLRLTLMGDHVLFQTDVQEPFRFLT